MVTEPDFDDVAGPQIPVDSMDEQRLLEGPLAALDVVADLEPLDGRRALLGRPARARAV